MLQLHAISGFIILCVTVGSAAPCTVLFTREHSQGICERRRAQRNATVKQRSVSSQTHHVHRTQIVTPDHQQSHHWTHHSGSVSTVSIEQSIRRKATRDFTTWVARESSEPPPQPGWGMGVVVASTAKKSSCFLHRPDIVSTSQILCI